MGTDVTTTATFNNVANWQGVDGQPVGASHNLVESGGVAALVGMPVINNVTKARNEILFTKDDVKVGDILTHNFASGYISYCNSDGTAFQNIGSSTAATTDATYIIPSQFAYAKVGSANGVTNATITCNNNKTNRELLQLIQTNSSKLDFSFFSNKRIIGYDTTSLTDMNNAQDNNLYLVRLLSMVPSNYHPQTKIYDSTDYEYVLTMFYNYYDNYKSGFGYQYIFDQFMNNLWRRSFTQNNNSERTFAAWVLCNPIAVEVGSDKYFTTIRSACEFAWANSNHEHPITIHVNSGTYDLIEEWGEELTESTAGIYIGKSMKLIFDEDAELTCNYEGNNATIATVFSGFMVGNGSFEIDGMKIHASNIRYCVHDEVGGESADDVKHIFRNCKMYIDNSNSPSSLGTTQCIGGGLGKFTNVLIENCIFDSECQDNEPVASYHMTTHFNDAKCHVVIKDNYCKRGTISGGYAGQTPATLKSPFLINGNSVKSAPFVFQGTSGAAENIDFMAWNNEIRS